MSDRPPRDHAIQCPHKWGDTLKRCICNDVRSDWLLCTGLGLFAAGLIAAAVAVPFIVYH